MFAIIRRYDGVDQNRSAELTRKVDEMLVPKLEKLSGFAGYYLIEADNGVFSSQSLRDARAGHGVDEVRRQLVARREARDDDPQRAEGHQRQGRRSQRPCPGRRVTSTAPHFDEKGPGLPGPFLFGIGRQPEDAGRPGKFAPVTLENAGSVKWLVASEGFSVGSRPVPRERR